MPPARSERHLEVRPWENLCAFPAIWGAGPTTGPLAVPGHPPWPHAEACTQASHTSLTPLALSCTLLPPPTPPRRLQWVPGKEGPHKLDGRPGGALRSDGAQGPPPSWRSVRGGLASGASRPGGKSLSALRSQEGRSWLGLGLELEHGGRRRQARGPAAVARVWERVWMCRAPSEDGGAAARLSPEPPRALPATWPSPAGRPRLTRSRAQQGGQQHQAEAIHGCGQHAPGGPREGAGLWMKVLRGAGLARRSLGQEPQTPAEPEAPSPFPAPERNTPPSESQAGGGGSFASPQSPTPSPSPRASTIIASPPGRTCWSAVSGRVTARSAPTRSWHLWGGG